MNNRLVNRIIFAAGTTVLVLGVTACAGAGYSNNSGARGSMPSRDMGQMNTQQGSQGETGTPHRMGPAGAAPAAGQQYGNTPALRRSDMGQMGTQQTPQGETGTPHTMGAPAAGGTRSQQPANSGLKPGEMGQMGTQGTPQGETGTPHRH